MLETCFPFVIKMLFYILAVIVITKLIGYAYGKFYRQNPKQSDVVLITGGCSGIGRQVALNYARHKCTVVVWDIAVHQFDNISTEITKLGGTPVTIRCDVSS
jgi:hypothetical protein